MKIPVPMDDVTKLMSSSHLMDDKDTDSGHDLIKADALLITKAFAGIIAGAGGVTAVLTGISAFLGTTGDGVKIALFAVAGAVVIATAVVVGWVVTTDVKARERLQRARYAARTEVLTDYFGQLDEDLLLNGRSGSQR